MRLHLLTLGHCDVDRGRLLAPSFGDGVRTLIPVPAYLLETDAGERVLIDTGMHPAHVDDPDHTFRGRPALASILRPVMTREDLISHRLAEIGLTIADVTHVFNTHLHFDHCGQNAAFPGIPILVHRRHYEVALSGPAFPNACFDLPELRYELFDGDRVEIFPGVTTISTHGHAPYHQSLLVELPICGPVLLAIDAIFVGDNLEHGAWGSHADPVAAADGGAVLERIAAERGARLVFGHDPDQWARLTRAPEGFYV
jgi:N-acyl homoserine lactone hydrolase